MLDLRPFGRENTGFPPVASQGIDDATRNGRRALQYLDDLIEADVLRILAEAKASRSSFVTGKQPGIGQFSENFVGKTFGSTTSFGKFMTGGRDTTSAGQLQQCSYPVI